MQKWFEIEVTLCARNEGKHHGASHRLSNVFRLYDQHKLILHTKVVLYTNT